MKDYLNVSEIGRLFGLGVQTIHYYDKVGILKPAVRSKENGYRKYKFDQIYQLASIRYLRKLGYSIEEIQEFQNTSSPQESIDMLRERSAALHAQWEEMMRLDDVIMRKIQYIENALADLEIDSVTVRELPARRYVPIGTEEEIYMEDSFYMYPTIAFYEENLKYFGALVENMADENEIRQMDISVIPAGRYLVGYHKGPYSSVSRRFREMMEAYPQYHYSGRVINFNIIDQFVEQHNENYVTEIQIQIL